MKKILSVVLSALIVLSGLPTAFAAESSTQPATSPGTSTTGTTGNAIKFSDVDANTPEGQAIYKLANAGIVNGKGDGTFDPNSGLTRAELCKMINLVFGYKEADTVQFNDVKSEDWFAPYVLVAKKAGYINGYEDGSFRGNNNITREEFCAILCRVTNIYDLGLKAIINDEVSGWAYEYVNKVVTNSLMPLEANKTFRATQNMKRSEIAVVLAKFVTVPSATTPVTGGVSVGGGSKRPSGGGGGSSSGGSSSGGSSSDDKEDDPSDSTGGDSGNTPEDTTTPEEYLEMNKEIIARLTTAKTALTNNRNKFRGTERTIVNSVVDVIGKILNDADKYEISYDNVLTNYTDEIVDTHSLYSDMSEMTRSNFKTKVADIDEETFDFLVEFFGLTDAI